MYFVEHQGADLLNEAIALRVMNGSGANVSQLLNLLETSKRRQIIMVKTEKDEPLASIAFAKISKFTLNLLIENPEHKLQPYEYNEGKILHIIDGFFKKHSFKQVVNLLTPTLRKYRLITYVKNGKLRVLYHRKGAFKLMKDTASQPDVNDLTAVVSQSF